MLRIARVLHGTTAEGPGLRTAIWFQGCSIRCDGCINPHLFSPAGGKDVSADDILRRAMSSSVEGLTLIGGEPFDQPLAGAELAQKAQKLGLGVIAFSGYEYESLRSRGGGTEEFLAAIDLLVDGPYEARNPEKERALVGRRTSASSISPVVIAPTGLRSLPTVLIFAFFLTVPSTWPASWIRMISTIFSKRLVRKEKPEG